MTRVTAGSPLPADEAPRWERRPRKTEWVRFNSDRRLKESCKITLKSVAQHDAL